MSQSSEEQMLDSNDILLYVCIHLLCVNIHIAETGRKSRGETEREKEGERERERGGRKRMLHDVHVEARGPPQKSFLRSTLVSEAGSLLD